MHFPMLFTVCEKPSWSLFAHPNVCMHDLSAFVLSFFKPSLQVSWGRDLVFFRNISRALDGAISVCKRGSLCSISAC